MKRENPIPEHKLKIVKELEELIKKKRTILIASIKNIPGSQFQEIVKKLRGKAIVKVLKKNLIFRALDKNATEEIKKIQEKIKDSFAILFSDLESFELAGELMKNQSPAKAKKGQEAPSDIEIPEGPTELIPGPAISELGALGIQIKIEGGKITIKAPKIVAKKGEKISQGAADLMSKLDIKPFKIGFIPLCSFDTQEKVFYAEIKVDREAAVEELRNIYARALPFAVEIGYSAPDTITFLIGKAGMHEKALGKLEPVKEKAEEKKEESGKEGKSDAESGKESVNDNSNLKKSSEATSEQTEQPSESEAKNTQTPEETKSEGEESK